MRNFFETIGGGIVILMLLGAVALMFALFLKGSLWLFTVAQDWISYVNGFVFSAAVLLIFFSIFPKLRIFTGVGITWCAKIWFVIFWFYCLILTYALWGAFGVLLGIFLGGVGVFITGPLAVLFSGESMESLLLVLNLMLIFGTNLLGYWIVSKHPALED